MKAWRRTEETAAEKLGGRRHPRRYGVSSPDTTVDDLGLVVEAKTRKRLPALITAALRQAEGYALRGFGQRPVAVLRETGSPLAVAVLWLDDLAVLLRRAEKARPSSPGPSPSAPDDRGVPPAVALAAPVHPSPSAGAAPDAPAAPGPAASAGPRGTLPHITKE